MPAFLRFFVCGIAVAHMGSRRDTVSRRSATRGPLAQRPRRLVTTGGSWRPAAHLQSTADGSGHAGRAHGPRAPEADARSTHWRLNYHGSLEAQPLRRRGPCA